MSLTNEQLYETIEGQQRTIDRLTLQLNKLQAWSDYNDLSLREMIDSLTDTVDKLCEEVKSLKATKDPE